MRRAMQLTLAVLETPDPSRNDHVFEPVHYVDESIPVHVLSTGHPVLGRCTSND